VQAHLAFVAAALVLSAAVLGAPKGRGPHRALGRAWAGAMAGAAVSGLFIWGHGPWFGFGPLHLLSVLVLVNLAQGRRAIRAGRRRAHALTMLGLMAGGLGVAGAFAVLGEGRLLHGVLLGG
jgi:uncharacterized membrane protein